MAQEPVTITLDPLVTRLRTAETRSLLLGRECAAALLGEAADEIERLEALTWCGCGDQFTAEDPGKCGNCVAMKGQS